MSRTSSCRKLFSALCLSFACLIPTARAADLNTADDAVSTGDAWQLDTSTYAGFAGDDNASAMALGRDGALYVAINSTRVPEENVRDLGADKTHNADGDIVLRKYRAGGSELEWTLLLGGAGTDTVQGLVLDGADNVYLCGSSNSAKLTLDTDARKDTDGRAAFAMKIDAQTQKVAWTHWFAGESAARAIALDNAGNLWLGGETSSDKFVSGARLGAGGRVDGWVAQLDANGQWKQALRIGGAGMDFVRALSFDERGALWLCGDTDSRDFPTVEGSKTPFHGGNDAWLMRLSPDLKLESSAFWGGSGDDFARALAVRDGRVVIAGFTTSARDENLRAERVGTLGRWDAFFAQADAEANDWNWSQLWGGEGNDFAAALAIDWRGALIVAGHEDSPDFPVKGAANDWHTQTLGTRGGIDSWLLRLEPAPIDTAEPDAILSAMRPTDALMLGGTGDDWLRGLVLGRNGLVLTGQTSSDDFPIANALQGKRGGATDAFAMWLRGRDALIAFAPDGDFPNDPAPSGNYPTEPAPDTISPRNDPPVDTTPRDDYPRDDTPRSDYPGNNYPSYPSGSYPGGGYPGDYYPDPYPNPYPYPSPYPNQYPSPYPYHYPRPGEPGGGRAELKLRIDPQTVSERAGTHAALGEVWRNTRRNETLVLSLESSRPDRVRVPRRVVIERGESSATFWIDVLDNNRADGDVKVYIKVRNGTSYYNFDADSESLRVLDDEGGRPEKPDFNPFGQPLGLRIEPQRLDKTGTAAARGRVTRRGDLSRPLRVSLSSSAPNLVRVPAQILIEARQDSADFALDVAPEALDAARDVQISARADKQREAVFTLTLSQNNRPAPNVPAPNSNFRLEVTITPDDVRPGVAQARGLVRRSGNLGAPLVVSLSSSDTNLVRVPALVTIPAGRDAVDFAVVLNPNVRDGATTAIVEANALNQRDTVNVRFERAISSTTPTNPTRPEVPRSVPAPPVVGNPQTRPNYRPDPFPKTAPARPTTPAPKPVWPNLPNSRPRVEPPRREEEQRAAQQKAQQKALQEALQREAAQRAAARQKADQQKADQQKTDQQKAEQNAELLQAIQREAAQRKAAQDDAQVKANQDKAQREAAQREALKQRATQEAAQAQREAAQRKAAQDAAQNKAAQEAAQREATKQRAAQEAAQREAAQDKAAQETARQQAAQRETAQREAAQRKAAQETTQREAAQRKAAQEVARREAEQRDAAQKKAAQDAVRREMEQREAAQRDAARREAEKREATQREAAQRDAQDRKIAQEAARRAAEEKAREDEKKKAAGRR